MGLREKALKFNEGLKDKTIIDSFDDPAKQGQSDKEQEQPGQSGGLLKKASDFRQ